MVIFNDPLPCPDPAMRAVRMAAAMRDCVRDLAAEWQRQGHELGFGVGIASGVATLGPIGFEGRRDYAAIGTVANLAARLCGEALSGQILVDPSVAAHVDAHAELEPLGEISLKGLRHPVTVANIVALR
jgi:class 3 adenylate cyclase